MKTSGQIGKITLTGNSRCAIIITLYAPLMAATAHNRVLRREIVPCAGESLSEIHENMNGGAKQLRVEVGQSIYVEKLDVQPGEEVVFNTVVLYANRTTKIGTPYVKGAKVTCKVEKQGKEKKVTIFKYKAKDGSSHRKQGHRQPYTKLTVEAIEA